jgi:uncharacterized membrane protein
MTNPSIQLQSNKLVSARIESIDLLRGIVMIIMALDHVRDYFHADAFLFNPLDLQKTNVVLFATRWITHLCAPVFVFLAGTSAFLVGSRKGKRELSSFLFKRGLWLLVLEFTVINFAWFFNINFELMALTVIWALGVSMIVLGVAIHLPFKVILALGVILVFGHNLLDSIHIDSVWWSLLHEQSGFQFGHFFVFVGYPLLPWIGTMFLGYCFGSLYLPSVNSDQRKKLLLQLGIAATLLFVVLRITDVYGEPYKWTTQENGAFTFLSFMNVTKYPPSLLYLLITLGPSLIFLALSENLKGRFAQYVISLGRVPMFYYIVHIAFVHFIALFAAKATGFDFSDMVFNTWVTDSPDLKGYGFSLGVTYLVWIAVVLILMPLCIWYDQYKIRNKEKWWLSYL